MLDYCAKCKRCHDDGLRDDEECDFYGEPFGCNHPNRGYTNAEMGILELLERYDELERENAELRETVEANLRVHKAAEQRADERVFALTAEIARLNDELSVYAEEGESK